MLYQDAACRTECCSCAGFLLLCINSETYLPGLYCYAMMILEGKATTSIRNADLLMWRWNRIFVTLTNKFKNHLKRNKKILRDIKKIKYSLWDYNARDYDLRGCTQLSNIEFNNRTKTHNKILFNKTFRYSNKNNKFNNATYINKNGMLYYVSGTKSPLD